MLREYGAGLVLVLLLAGATALLYRPFAEPVAHAISEQRPIGVQPRNRITGIDVPASSVVAEVLCRHAPSMPTR